MQPQLSDDEDAPIWKLWVGTVLALGIGLSVISYFFYVSFETAQLAYGGTETVALVTDYQSYVCGGGRSRRTCHYASLSFDGNTQRVSWERRVGVGARVPIVYLASDPSVVREGRIGNSPRDFFIEHFEYWYWGSLIFGPSLLWFAWGYFNIIRRRTRSL